MRDPQKPGSPLWPTITIRDGRMLRVRDSFLFAFFLRREDIQPAIVGDAFRRFLNGIGHGKIRFFVDEEGEMLPFPRDYAALIEQDVVEPTARADYAELALLGSEENANVHEVFYCHNPEVPAEERPNKLSVLTFRIAQETFLDVDTSGVISFFEEMCALLSCEYAYGHPALVCDNAHERTYPIVKRYPGFDIAEPASAAWNIRGRIMGPYWLNAFGPSVMSTLGPSSVTPEALPPEVEIRTLQNGIVVAKLGEYPAVGDVNRRDRLPLYRDVAKRWEHALLQPEILYFQPTEDIDYPRVAQEEWHRRFVDE